MSEGYNDDGTRTDAKITKDFAGMGDVIGVITEVIAGSQMAEKVASERQDVVDRNVAHLEIMKAMADWGSENMTATTNAITAGKGYTAS